jgi:hypothetical protein
MPPRPQPRPHRSHTTPSAHRHLTAVPTPPEGSVPPDSPEALLNPKETYAEEQARLDAEAVERWAVLVTQLPPLTNEQIRALAVILNRIEARLATERATAQDRAA